MNGQNGEKRTRGNFKGPSAQIERTYSGFNNFLKGVNLDLKLNGNLKLF